MPLITSTRKRLYISTGLVLVIASIPLSLVYWPLFFVCLFVGVILLIAGVLIHATEDSKQRSTSHPITIAKSSLQTAVLFAIIFSLLVFVGMAVLLVFAFGR